MDTKKIKGVKRDYLAKIFAKKEFTKGVEVGVRWGAFSEILCQKNPRLELKSVDPYRVIYQDFRSNREGRRKQDAYFKAAIKLLKPYNCEIIRKTSLEAVQDFLYESIDFVYIDGSHHFDFVMTDIIEWTKRVKKGGIVSGHDYYNFRKGDVIDAVDIYCKMHKIKRIFLTDERTPSWWFTKTW